jgi:hypothetical protein
MMIMEQLVEWELAGETDVLGENLPQCHFVLHKSLVGMLIMNATYYHEIFLYTELCYVQKFCPANL